MPDSARIPVNDAITDYSAGSTTNKTLFKVMVWIVVLSIIGYIAHGIKVKHEDPAYQAKQAHKEQAEAVEKQAKAERQNLGPVLDRVNLKLSDRWWTTIPQRTGTRARFESRNGNVSLLVRVNNDPRTDQYLPARNDPNEKEYADSDTHYGETKLLQVMISPGIQPPIHEGLLVVEYRSAPHF